MIGYTMRRRGSVEYWKASQTERLGGDEDMKGALIMISFYPRKPVSKQVKLER